eukprot:8642697-Pyramimonas_sp.AAC.2
MTVTERATERERAASAAPSFEDQRSRNRGSRFEGSRTEVRGGSRIDRVLEGSRIELRTSRIRVLGGWGPSGPAPLRPVERAWDRGKTKIGFTAFAGRGDVGAGFGVGAV